MSKEVKSPFSSGPTPNVDICCKMHDENVPKWRFPVHNRRVAFAATPDGIQMGSPMYYAVCAFGGSLCCLTTHVVTLPIDLVKCRMQVNPSKYPNMAEALKITLKEDGVRGLVRGWAATTIGYGAQGIVRFGLYEYFKLKFAEKAGPETFYLYRTLIYLAAAASAEFLADIPLSPFEGIKVRTQTIPGFPAKLREAIPLICEKEGIRGMFKTLVPLWGRQIPYTMVKFTTFERTLEFLYKNVVGKKPAELPKSEQLVVTFVAGYTAGIFCAIASHPSDTMISKLQAPGATISSVYRQIGFHGLWKGIGPRILMIGTIAASQWLIYDAVKVAFNVPRPPPPEKPKSLQK